MAASSNIIQSCNFQGSKLPPRSSRKVDACEEYKAFFLLSLFIDLSNLDREKEMKHGKNHRAEVAKSLPEWERKFMAYKALKKKLKRSRSGSERFSDGGSNEANLATEDIDFTLLLNRELDKINTFYFDKEEDYVIRFRELKIRAENLNCNEETVEVQKEILDFHSEMMMLLHYSVVNFAGWIKTVKKHKKRTGAYSVHSSYMPRVLQQPFVYTDLLYNLIKGCEAILDHLSPPIDP